MVLRASFGGDVGNHLHNVFWHFLVLLCFYLSITEHFNDARLVDLALNQAAKSNDSSSEKNIIFAENLDISVHLVTCHET